MGGFIIFFMRLCEVFFFPNWEHQKGDLGGWFDGTRELAPDFLGEIFRVCKQRSSYRLAYRLGVSN